MKLLFALMATVGMTIAQTPIIAPATPSVSVGESITLTSSVPVTWTLGGNGTITAQSPTSVTYTAPSVLPQFTSQGCPVVPSDSIFATRIDNLPVHKSSATWLNTSGNASATGINFLSAWGITRADASTPRVSITPFYGDNQGNNPTYLTPFPGRMIVARENGSYNGNHTHSDHHTIVVDTSICMYYEFYNELIGGLDNAEFTTFEPCRYNGVNCNAASEIPPYLAASFTMPPTSTDAAGLPLAPLTWTLADIKSGPQHAVRFTTSQGYISSSTFLWPATQANGWNANAAGYGSRWRLRTTANGGPDIPAVCGSNDDCSRMLTALTLYGMVEADIGSQNQVQVADDAVSDPSVRAAMNLIAQADIGPQYFDVIDESSLEQMAPEYQVPATGSFAIKPLNSYVTPPNYALVTATPLIGSPVSISIALQGIGIGLSSNTMAIAAGLGGYQINSWVTPASVTQTVHWTLISGAGSVSSTGFYIPPSQINGPTQAVLKVSAEADPNVCAFLYVNVLTNNSGTYSIDFNAPTQTLSPSKVWNTDFGVTASTANFFGVVNDYPAWFTTPGTLIPEALQYGSVLYTYGGDIRYKAILPNGNYQVRLMQGQPYDGNYPSTVIPDSLDLADAPEFIDVNGSIVSHYYDWEAAVGYLFGTPQDVLVPATVTDNTLTIGIRTVSPDIPVTAASGIGPLYPGLYPFLLRQDGDGKGAKASGLEIIPDEVAPHWQIDSQAARSISPGQSIQLYVIDWHTGMNDATWSIVTGPPGSSISSSGLLSLSGTASSVGVPIVAMASDGIYSATITINLPSSPDTPVITWAVPKPIVAGTALGPLQLNAQTSISGTFVYSPPPGTSLPPGLQELGVTFLPNDTVHYNSAQSTVVLQVNPFRWKRH